MPRYFFDVEDGIIITDKTGQELPDLDAAHSHALRLTRNYAGSPGMIGEDGGVMVVTIRDKAGMVFARHRLVFGIEHVEPNSERVSPGASLSH